MKVCLLILIVFLLQYPFTTVIPNLGVWVPPQAETDSLDGAGSEGLVLCVSEPFDGKSKDKYGNMVHDSTIFCRLVLVWVFRTFLVLLPELLKELDSVTPFFDTSNDVT